MDPVHPELQSVRADLIHHREEELAVRRLQQSQLDSLQVQIRELAQQQTEFSEQMTEVANAVTDMFHQLGVLRNTFNQAMNDMLRHFESPEQLPPTQLAATQPEDAPSLIKQLQTSHLQRLCKRILLLAVPLVTFTNCELFQYWARG